MIGKSKIQNSFFRNRLIISKFGVTSKKIFAEKFNDFLVDTGPTLATKLPKTKNRFTRHLSTINTILDER